MRAQELQVAAIAGLLSLVCCVAMCRCWIASLPDCCCRRRDGDEEDEEREVLAGSRDLNLASLSRSRLALKVKGRS